MENKKWIRFAESFILLPALTMSGTPIVSALGPISQAVMNIANTPSIVSSQKQNNPASDLSALSAGELAIAEAIEQKLEAQKVKADAIDTYFKAHDMPLEGIGMKMVQEAEKNNLDWRLMPAIAVRESSGGKNACDKMKNNPFGWGSCKIGFDSMDEAIETVALNLGGNNPDTAKYYDNKTTKQILRAYNPPSIVPRYAEQVISIMNSIGEADTTVTTVAISNTTA